MPIRRLYLLFFLPLLPFTKIIGTEGMKRVFLNYLWGLNQQELDELATEFVDQIFPDAFYSEMLEVVDQQKAMGHTTILSSASPEIWVKPIAEKLGFDHHFGTTLEIAPKVRFIPKIIGGNNKGENKLRKMCHLLPYGLNPDNGDTLFKSYGFSDSHADLPMLRICQHVGIVHPTDKLIAASQQHNWQLYSPTRPTTGKIPFAIACLKQALGLYSPTPTAPNQRAE